MSRISAARGSLLGMHLVLFALVLAIVGEFLGWHWHPLRALAAPLGCCAVATIALAWIDGWRTRPFVWLALVLASVGAWSAGRMTVAANATPNAWLYAIVAVAVGALPLRLVRRRLTADVAAAPWAEELRIVSLLVIATWIFRPYLTSDFFGGIDARSYGYGMTDVLQQARAGVFPVFVGQSEFMFEGVIHPIRTAPYHHHFGIVLDWLTLRRLEPVAVEHLTVVLTAMLGALSCYICLALLAPRQRRIAWAMAALYISAPAVSGFIYGQEMYMTFMSIAWLPLVFFGNVRLFQSDDWTGWKTLAAGLALVWMCHAPVGAWLTLATIVLQTWRLFANDTTKETWRRVAGGAGLFLGLSAYYFWSVGELVASGDHPVPGKGATMISFTLLVFGFAMLLRYLATNGWRWLVPAVAAVVGLWLSFTGYALWLGASTVLVIAWNRITALRPAWAWRNRTPEISLILVLAAGLLVMKWSLLPGPVAPFALVEGLFPNSLRPISERANTLSDLQLGYALLGAWLLGVAALFRTTSLAVRALVLVGILGLVLLLPVPGLTKFLLGSVPEPISAISSASLWLRYLPSVVALCAFMGCLGAATWIARHPRSRGPLTILACLAVVWSVHESGKFVRSGYSAKQSTGQHSDFRRPENAAQFAYIFSWMPVSPYLVNGVMDHHLESRLLRVDNPEVQLSETVPWSDPQWQTLTGEPDPGGPNWLNLSPTLILSPGERCVLRFRFFDRPYNGVLILRGPGGWYRQYQLPDAGFYPKSFGVAPERPKIIALWNSSAAPQPVELVFYRPELPATTPADFAEMAVMTLDPDKLPIRTRGLIPYRADVALKEPAWLETPRRFIPGYRAKVNGQPAPVVDSPNHNVMVKLAAGENQVELRYTGTAALWLALILSAATWCWLLGSAGRTLWRQLRGDAAPMPPVV